jgi:hypothetical protein
MEEDPPFTGTQDTAVQCAPQNEKSLALQAWSRCSAVYPCVLEETFKADWDVSNLGP